MPFAVDLVDRVRIDIDTFARFLARIAIARTGTDFSRRALAVVEIFGKDTEQIAEDVIIVLRLEVQRIGAHAELERPRKIRLQPYLPAPLPVPRLADLARPHQVPRAAFQLGTHSARTPDPAL